MSKDTVESIFVANWKVETRTYHLKKIEFQLAGFKAAVCFEYFCSWHW